MFEKLTKAKKLAKAKQIFMDSMGADSDWQREARTAFKFRDGEQWTSEEKKILEEELRPVLTFNMTKSSVDLIMGMNEDNKMRHRATPSETNDGFLAEVLNDASDWVYEQKDFEAEENDALESATICGRGFVAIDFVPDPKRFGEIDISLVSVPVHELHFDPAARRPTLEDASYICWDRWIPIEEFKMRYPQIKGKSLEALVKEFREWGTGGGDDGNTPQAPFELPVDVDQDDSDYDDILDLSFYDKAKQMIRVVHMEYWEVFDRYYAFNPETGQFEEIEGKPNPEQKEMFLQTFGQEMVIETIKDKRVKWIHFTGDQIVFDDISPLEFNGFSIVNMFAFTDVSKRSMNHFGIVKGMIDPQREINKRWSQTLNMLNNQSQPGVYAETDAFVDEMQAKQSMKEPGGITYINSGALQAGKLQERTVPNFPNAPMQMEEYSQDIIRKITGINPDLLGQDRGRQEPGVVVRLRQQQGIVLLKPLFRNFNQLKKGVFKRLLSIITAYMPDQQLMRILGTSGRYQIDPQSGILVDQMTGLQAEIRNVRDLEYNIKAEPAPGNMSKRMLELTALMEMMQAGFPVDPAQVIEKMEIPESEKTRWMQYMQQQEESAQQQQQEQMAVQLDLENRKIAVDEQANILDFIVDTAKIDQMKLKDNKKMAMDIQRMSQDERRNLADFALGLVQALTAAKQAEQGENDGKETSGSKSAEGKSKSKTKK